MLHVRISGGRLFQTSGAAMANTLLPHSVPHLGMIMMVGPMNVGYEQQLVASKKTINRLADGSPAACRATPCIRCAQ